ncbi:MAG: TolC family protein [Gemmatimonadetes bacterium]|nr:TolC family protein [Gemmatimonadota bacterium]MYE93800.1 TolC family protein [Gemmatimonadota bacterium]MYJ11682.1 TolC family protein [Gemmatimonadota bacterium]
MVSLLPSCSWVPHWTRRNLLVFPALLASVSGVRAQEGDSIPDADATPATLSLEYVLNATLAHSFPIERKNLRRRARQGELQATAGMLDSRFTTSMSRARDVRAGVASSGLDGPALEQNTTAYRVTMERTLRSGITVAPQVQVSHLAVNAGTPYSTASVRLDFAVPLLRNRGGSLIRSSQTTVTRLLDADTHSYLHARSAAVLAALTAYWRYVASFARLEVQRASAKRALDLVRETEVLVGADERPPADLNHVRGNLAVKRGAVLAAEQDVVVSRADLGLVMGIPREQVFQLQHPAEALPRPAPVSTGEPPQSLVTLALQNRADLAAAGALTRASAVVEEAARQESRRGLDLFLSTGYTGIGQGHGYDPLYSSLVSNVRGLNMSIGLQWEARFSNDHALGNVLTRSAQHEEARIAEQDLARQVEVHVEVGIEGVQRSSRSVMEVAEAVRLSRTTVENERIKHRLGSATLFDVILAEDNLTSALLAEVAAQLKYAIALADLRYQTATLLQSDSVLSVERLNTLPPPAGG